MLEIDSKERVAYLSMTTVALENKTDGKIDHEAFEDNAKVTFLMNAAPRSECACCKKTRDGAVCSMIKVDVTLKIKPVKRCTFKNLL